MLNVSDALEKAIKENLPSMVGEELKKVLAKAESDSEKVKHLTESNRLGDTALKVALATISQLESLGIKQEDLEKREENLREEKRNLRVVLAEAKATNSEVLAKQSFELVNAVFRNSEIKKHVMDSNSSYVTIPGHAGNNWQSHNENKNTTKQYTETQETK